MKLGLVVLSICTLLCFSVLPISASRGSLLVKDAQVEYELPFPGISPEHPFFLFKQLRDDMVIFLKREPMEKAEYLLLASDKRAHMGLLLAEKGKTQQSIEIMADAEKKARQIPDLVRQSKKMGVSASGDFLYKLQLSNIKHMEVLQSMAKITPPGPEQEKISRLLEINAALAQDLKRL